MSFDRKRIHKLEDRIEELTQALEEAVYLLNPTEEDMQKKAGVYRVVTALKNCTTTVVLRTTPLPDQTRTG